MKQTNLFILISILSNVFSLSGCLKKDKQRYTVSGHIYQNCSKQPVANRTFIFYQVGGGGDIIDSAKTDANGYFTLNYVPKNGSEIRVGIELNVGVSEYGEFLPGRNYPNILLYKQPTCYLKVSTQVFNSSYTNQDTLYVTDFNRPNIPLKFAGPFTNRTLYTITDYSIINRMYPEFQFAWYYKINGNDFLQKTVSLVACDTANAIIEIR